MSAATNVPTAAQRWVDEIEKHERSIESVRMKAAADCKPFHQFIREAKAAAKNEGIGVRALNELLYERKLLKKLAARGKALDENFVEELEVLRDQVAPVEDIELFSFAAGRLDEEIAEAKAKRQNQRAKVKSDAIDSLTDDFEAGDDRPPHLRAAHEQIEAEQRAAAENAAKLESGIKTLN